MKSVKRNRPSGVHLTGLEKVLWIFNRTISKDTVVLNSNPFTNHVFFGSRYNFSCIGIYIFNFPALSDCNPPSFPPFGRSNRLSTLFKLAVMQLTQNANAVQLTHDSVQLTQNAVQLIHNAVQLAHSALHGAAIKHSLQLIHFCTFLTKLDSVHYQLHPLQ